MMTEDMTEDCAKPLTFGDALKALKASCAVTRAAWRNPEQTVMLVHGSIPQSDSAEKEDIDTGDVARKLFDVGDLGTLVRLPDLVLHTASNTIMAWTPTVEDLLAEDWDVVYTP